jgi:hypothetical protein
MPLGVNPIPVSVSKCLPKDSGSEAFPLSVEGGAHRPPTVISPLVFGNAHNNGTAKS